MRAKLMSLFAIALLAAACSSAPEDTGSATGQGQAANTTSSGSPSGSGVASAPAPGIVPGSQEDLVVNVGDRIFFGFDKSDISSDAAATLKKQAAWMQSNQNVTVIVEGHCDERGTREYNLALGERRANAMREQLISLGVSTARIETISYGKERPAVAGSTESAWSQNRRGVMVRKGAGS
ncbi:MAG: peptidoglycan-associated lipoprotein Pal [Proteobacteria bacterium]|nr:peptidoglycan-associated lipoprotein Pal [Pseudomonadota bacterium]